jgi:hypothetical protein
VERATIICEKDYWEQVKRNGWSYKLQRFIKASTQNLAFNFHIPYNLAVPPICMYNQRNAMLRSKFKVKGKDMCLVILTMNVLQHMQDQRQWNAGGGFFVNHAT